MKEMKNEEEIYKMDDREVLMELIDFVKSIKESDDTIPEGFADYDSEDYDPDYSLDHYMKRCDVYEYIQDLSCIAFINSNGSVNLSNVIAANKAGVSVYQGEYDSFGWLTGCIDTARGTVVFG